jgi:hypothetical protein
MTWKKGKKLMLRFSSRTHMLMEQVGRYVSLGELKLALEHCSIFEPEIIVSECRSWTVKI